MKVTVDVKNLTAFVIGLGVVGGMWWGINMHMKRRRLLEIYHVLEKIVVKNVSSNEKK